MRKAFPIGSEVEVVVLESDPAGRRIRLSRKAVAEQARRRNSGSTPRGRMPRRAHRSGPSPTNSVVLSGSVEAPRHRYQRAIGTGGRMSLIASAFAFDGEL